MKSLRLNNYFSLLANLAVLGGLILVAVELNQTNDLMAAQDRYNRLTILTNSQSVVFADSNIAAIMVKSFTGEQLSPEESLAFRTYVRQILRIMEWTYRELPESELPIEQWRRNFSNEKFLNEVWRTESTEYDATFIQFVESEIVRS